jgi:hypothetical protein
VECRLWVGKPTLAGERGNDEDAPIAMFVPIAGLPSYARYTYRMRKSRDDLIEHEIMTHRARTETRIGVLLKEGRSPATLDHIKALILNEHERRSFNDYVFDLVALFDTGLGGVEIDDLLPALQDAWNYFPHQRYGGQCPAERFLQQESSLATKQSACPNRS